MTDRNCRTCQTGAEHVFNGQTQVGHRDSIGLGDEGATVGRLAAQVGDGGFEVVVARTNGHTSIQDQASGHDIYCGVTSGVKVNDVARLRCHGHAGCAYGNTLKGHIARGSVQRHVAIISTNSGSNAHGYCVTSYQFDSHCRGSTSRDTGVLQDVMTGIEAAMASRVEHRSTQREVAAAASGADQEVAGGADGTGTQRVNAASAAAQNQVARAGQVALDCVSGSRHCHTIRTNPVVGHCVGLPYRQGGGLKQVQTTATDIGTELGCFEFKMVVTSAHRFGCCCGAQAQLVGIHIYRAIGVVQNAAASTEDAHCTPGGLVAQTCWTVARNPCVQLAHGDVADRLEADAARAAAGLNHGTVGHGQAGARVKLHRTSGSTDVACRSQRHGRGADQTDVAAACIQAGIQIQCAGNAQQHIAADRADGIASTAAIDG